MSPLVLPGQLVPGLDPASMAKAAFDGLTSWITDGASALVGQVISFISNSTGVDLPGAYSTPGAHSTVLFSKVCAVSATLLIGFVCLAVLQSLMQGEPGLAVRALLVRVPTSIFATVVLVAVTDVLLRATDGASTAMIGESGGDLVPFQNLFANTTGPATGGAAVFFLALVFMAAAMMCLLTLVIRSALIYILVALAPVALAARVWPAAGGAWKKLCEVGVALILSKFAIAVALGVGAALLGDGSTLGANTASGADSVGQSIGKLAAGSVIMGLAAFMPFLLLKLVPMAEHAVAAEGAKGGPGRALNRASNTQYQVSRLTSTAKGGRSPGGGPASSGAPSGPGPTTGPSGASLATAPAGGGAAGAGVSAGAGGGAGLAAAGPAAIPLIAATAAKQGAAKVKQTVAQTAQNAGDIGGRPSTPASPASSPGRREPATASSAAPSVPSPVKPSASPLDRPGP